MAFKTLGQLKDSLAGLLTGTNLDNVVGINRAIERAAAITFTKADVPEASGREPIILYSGVFDYETPETIFGTALVDLRPQGVDRWYSDEPTKRPIVQFDRQKNLLPYGTEVAFEYKDGVGIMRVSSPYPMQRAIIDTMTETAGWTAAGSASGLAQDSVVYYSAPASLRFTLTGSSTGTLTKAVQQQNLSVYQGVGVVFLAVYAPDVTNLTSISIKLGSSAAAYTEVTETEGFLGAWIANDWLLVAFDLAGATDTGTPDYTAIDYFQVSIAHTGTITNFRVGGVWVSYPSPHEVLYQSNAIFKASGQAPSTTITDDNDEIILNDAAYVIFEHESAIAIANQDTSTDSAQIQKFRTTVDDPKEGLYNHYRGNNPSQQLRQIGNWYSD